MRSKSTATSLPIRSSRHPRPRRSSGPTCRATRRTRLIRKAASAGKKQVPAEQWIGATASARTDGAQLADQFEEPVREALRESGDALGRSDLVACTGMPDCAWEPTIRRLVESGTVLQEGAKRGAKYRLAESGQ